MVSFFAGEPSKQADSLWQRGSLACVWKDTKETQEAAFVSHTPEPVSPTRMVVWLPLIIFTKSSRACHTGSPVPRR